MHIELAELLRCPEQHEETFCVVSADKTDGRTVITGLVGCPVCRNEYLIDDGAVRFTKSDGPLENGALGGDIGIDAGTAQALLNLSGAGGNVVLVGSASRLASGLADLVEGVHFVACNASTSILSTARVSVLYAPQSIPLRTSSMRGLVLGAEMFTSPWIEESLRVLLRGTRFVALGQTTCPDGVTQLAVSDGIVVGEKI